MILPDKHYREIEYMLHQCLDKYEEAKQAYIEIETSTLKGVSCEDGGKNACGTSAVEGLAMKRAAIAEKMEYWKAVISASFYVENTLRDTQCKLLFDSYYGHNIMVKEFSAKYGIDRKTVNSLRDKVVTYMALTLVDRGILKWGA